MTDHFKVDSCLRCVNSPRGTLADLTKDYVALNMLEEEVAHCRSRCELRLSALRKLKILFGV